MEPSPISTGRRLFCVIGEPDAELPAPSPDYFARFANKRARRNGKFEQTSDDSVDVSNELGAAGGHVENLAFVAANVVVERDPRAVMARFPRGSFGLRVKHDAQSSPQFVNALLIRTAV
jgi:hypothetical protein